MPWPRRLVELLAAVLAAGAGCADRSAPAAPVPVPPASTLPAAPGTADDLSSPDRFRQPDKLIAALMLRDGDVVAEVGSGAGYLTPRLARAVGARGRVVATDIEAGFLLTLKQRAAAAHLDNVTTRLVAKDDPGLEPASYDVLFLAQVDHQLPDRAAWLRKALPALKPGGRIAISNRDRWKDGLLSSIKDLPLRVVEDPVQLPGQFLVFLVPHSAPGAHP